MPAEPAGLVRVPAMELDAARAVLAPPWLHDAAAREAALVCAGASLAVPVLLDAVPGGTRLRLARALHAVAERAGFFVAATGAKPRLSRVPIGATLYLDVSALDPALVPVLDALLDDGRVWLLAGSTPGTAVPDALRARLSTLALHVPPLCARLDDLPALVPAILARLTARRRADAPAVAPSALAQLAHHDWPGDEEELEAVLARALLVCGDGPLGAEHLALAPSARAPEATSEPRATDGAGAAALEYLLAEMAHEVKNPLVTIKTFADHLPALLEDEALRAQFADLAGDAIERIDGVLENVLEFARLGAPLVASVDVGPVLDDLVEDMASELSGRSVAVRRVGGGARCAADREHVVYALRNLLTGVVRAVPPRQELVLDASVNGVVRVGFTAGATAATRLHELVQPDGPPTVDDPAMLPLPFTLARAALERNGGTLAVEPGVDGRTTVVVRLPVAA